MRNETIFLTDKKNFCMEAGEIFLSAKKKLFAVENEEVVISIWSSHGNKTHTAILHVICKSMELFIVSTV